MESNELKFELRSEEIFPNGFSLEDFEKTFKENQNVIKNNRNIIKKLRFGDTETVTKSFKRPNFIQGIIYKFFRKTKARRSFEHSLLLNQMGIRHQSHCVSLKYSTGFVFYKVIISPPKLIMILLLNLQHKKKLKIIELFLIALLILPTIYMRKI